MAIVINGSGTVTGLAVGGLPDGTVDDGTLASGISKTSITDGGNATAITIDASENVGIGVTPENWNSAYAVLQTGGTGAQWSNVSQAAGSIFDQGQNMYRDASAERYIITDEASKHRQYSGTHIFQVAPSGTADAAITWTTAMTIDNSGNVLAGATAASDVTGGTAPGIELAANGTIWGSRNGTSGIFNRITTNGTAVDLKRQGNSVGTISVTTSATAYNTSSDYRLKENVDYTWDATTRLKQLKPARFNFIIDDTNTLVDGFLAHEVSSIVPEAITGTKDAMMDEEYEVTPAIAEVRDADDNITTEAVEAVMGTRSVPDMQGIDQSKLVPLLVKTILELEARLTAGGL